MGTLFDRSIKNKLKSDASEKNTGTGRMNYCCGCGFEYAVDCVYKTHFCRTDTV